MGGFFTSILPFANTLNEFSQKFRSVKKERREAVAAYLVKIAQTIDQASSSLKQGKPPHEECAKLQIYAEQFSKVVGELIPKDVVERLSMDLNDFGPSQELLEIYQSFQESAEYELVEASGILKALADTLIAAEIVH